MKAKATAMNAVKHSVFTHHNVNIASTHDRPMQCHQFIAGRQHEAMKEDR